MNPRSPEEQIRFLEQLQRLLQDGQFVATYKYALILSLADIAVESADDSGSVFPINTSAIAEKFIRYYWRQSVPFVNTNGADILVQNTGRQAGVINLIVAARQQYGPSLPNLKRNRAGWSKLVKKTNSVVKEMHLWKLQTVGQEKLEFLYDNSGGNSITLKPGVTFCFRKFRGIVGDLVQSAWITYVRRFNQNVMGETVDLQEFLFGTDRSSLAALVPILMEFQNGRCFYCERDLSRGEIQVDHFVPWARYPIDLGHNFVLADSSCNSKKGDRLPCSLHLDRWLDRNIRQAGWLSREFESQGITHDTNAALHVANWAYTQTFNTRGMTWLKGDELMHLDDEWNTKLRTYLC